MRSTPEEITTETNEAITADNEPADGIPAVPVRKKPDPLDSESVIRTAADFLSRADEIGWNRKAPMKAIRTIAKNAARLRIEQRNKEEAKERVDESEKAAPEYCRNNEE